MDPKTELELWVIASLLLSIIGAWLAWRFSHMQARSAEWLRRRLLERIPGRIFLQVVRLAYYVGLPYAAALHSALSLVQIGVHGPEVSGTVWWTLGWHITDWAHALGWAASIGAVVAVVQALAWRNAAHATGHLPQASGLCPPPPWWGTVREVLYGEIHWAFYRALPLLVLSDAYWAVLIGAAFPLLEWTADPDWWMQVRGGPRRETVLIQCMWLATSTVYFCMVRNVWLALALHLVLALALSGWLAFLSGHDGKAQEAIAA